jgi:hypothetical protein
MFVTTTDGRTINTSPQTTLEIFDKVEIYIVVRLYRNPRVQKLDFCRKCVIEIKILFLNKSNEISALLIVSYYFLLEY